MDIRQWKAKYLALDMIEDYEVAKNVIVEFKECFKNKEAIIYGAGVVGQEVYNLFLELGVKVATIVDKNYRNCKFEKCEVSATNTIKLLNQANKYEVFLAVGEFREKEMLDDFNKLGTVFQNPHFALRIQKILQSAICYNKACNDQEIYLPNCYECVVFENECVALQKYAQKLNHFTGKKTNASKNFKTVGYILGQVCTLSCKCCNESVPYVSKIMKKFVKKDTVLKDIEKVAASCEFLGIVELVGGEPLLHPELDKILQGIMQIENVGIIHIFTSGTVVPNEEIIKLLENPRIVIYVSNYGDTIPEKLQNNILETKQLLKSKGVLHKEGNCTSWMDFSTYDYIKESNEELKNRFKNCYLGDCHRLYEGYLYRCSHHYAGTILDIFKEENDRISIHAYTQEELAVKLELFESAETAEACKFCKMPFDAEIIGVAEQMEK